MKNLNPNYLKRELLKRGYSEESSNYLVSQWQENPERREYGTEQQSTTDVLESVALLKEYDKNVKGA